MYPERVSATTGAIFLADAEGTYTVWRCDWLVRDFSLGSPEPDSFADTFRDVPCEATMRDVDGVPTCDHGHARTPYDAASDADWAAYEREHGDDIHAGNSLAHVC